MPYLLNVVYLLLIVLASPWLLYVAVRHGKYREGYAEKFLGRVPSREPSPGGDSPRCVWLHAVSVGEVNLLGTLIERIAERRPDWQCVVSTTTKTGYELARRRYPQLSVFYCPLDFSWAVRAAMRLIRPDVLVLAELELWPNLIRAAKAHGAAVAIINGRLSDHSFRGYRRIGPLVRRVLRQVDLVAAQSKEIAERFRALGCPTTVVRTTGSLKYDGAQTDRQNEATRRLAHLAGFAEDDVVLLAGSTQEPEEEYALAVYKQLVGLHPRLRLVLVPRHPQRFEAVAQLLTTSGLDWQRRSELGGDGVSTPPMDDGRDRTALHGGNVGNQRPVLLVDAVGELGAWWGTATIGLVGGSFGSRGGQNMIEPAAYGVATCFGPNTGNFRDVVAALLAADGARVVHTANDLTAFVRRCLEEPEFAHELGERARRFVESQLGATERTVALLEDLIDACPHEARVRPAA